MKKTLNNVAFTTIDTINAIKTNTTGAARSYSYELAAMGLDEPAWIVYYNEKGSYDLVWGNELNIAARWAWFNGIQETATLYRVFPDGNAYEVLRHE